MRIDIDTATRDQMFCRIFLNGKEVTTKCTCADNVEGWAELRQKPYYYEKIERHYGRVEIIMYGNRQKEMICRGAK